MTYHPVRTNKAIIRKLKAKWWECHSIRHQLGHSAFGHDYYLTKALEHILEAERELGLENASIAKVEEHLYDAGWCIDQAAPKSVGGEY